MFSFEITNVVTSTFNSIIIEYSAFEENNFCRLRRKRPLNTVQTLMNSKLIAKLFTKRCKYFTNRKDTTTCY